MAFRPVCSGPLLLLLLAAASTTAALLLLPAVTLHRPAPRRDQARRRPATRPPAPPRVQVQHARLLSVEPAEPLGLKVPTAASRSPTHAALARSPEPAPAGGRARCWPRPPTAGQLAGRARARGAPPRRAAAPEEKNGPGGAQGEPDSPRRSTPKCSTGKTFFFCESSLLRINQRHHSLETRPWHTPPAAVRKPTEESTRERGLGVGLGRDSRYGSIYVCPPPPRDPRALVLPPSSLPLPFSPRDPTPSTRPTGRWRGT